MWSVVFWYVINRVGKCFSGDFSRLKSSAGRFQWENILFGHIEEFLSHVKLSERILFTRFFLMKTSPGKNNFGLRKNIIFVLLCGTRASFFIQIMNLSFFTNLRNFLSFMCETEWKLSENVFSEFCLSCLKKQVGWFETFLKEKKYKYMYKYIFFKYIWGFLFFLIP